MVEFWLSASYEPGDVITNENGSSFSRVTRSQRVMIFDGDVSN